MNSKRTRLCEECRNREEEGRKFLDLLDGEADVLKDIFEVFDLLMENGQITMSATDSVDFKSLKGKVEDL